MKSQTSKLIISVRSYAAEKCQTTEMSCFEVFHCKKMQPKAIYLLENPANISITFQLKAKTFLHQLKSNL